MHRCHTGFLTSMKDSQISAGMRHPILNCDVQWCAGNNNGGTNGNYNLGGRNGNGNGNLNTCVPLAP